DATRSRIRRRRRGARIHSFAAIDLSTASSNDAANAHSVAGLDDLVLGLDHDRRAAFVLTQITGLRYEEAADVLGVPVGTIRSRVSRARADLVAAMTPADGWELEQRRRRPS